jgi:type IV pilus assembly protein PilN
MRVSLNLASRPYIELRPLYQRLRVFALLLLVTGAVLFWALRIEQRKAAAARGRVETIETATARIQRERQQAEASMRRPDNAAVLAQSQFLNNLYLHKAFSWTAVMMDLERVLPPGVQVLNLDPVVAKDGSVTIRLRVAGPRERSIELVRNLEHSRRFRSPRIASETAQNASQNGQVNPNFQAVNVTNGVNFDVLAEYNPLPTTAEKRAEEADAKEKNQAKGEVHTGRSRRRSKPAAGGNAASSPQGGRP